MKFYRVQALLLKYWYISINSLERFFDILYWPIIGIIVFGFTTSYVEKISDFPDIFVFLLGGLMFWIMLERVQQDIAVFILEDFWSGNVANSFITPIKESEIFTSVALLGLIRASISFIIIFTIALFAYKFNIFRGGLLSTLFIIPLIIFGWSLGIFIAGLIFRYGMRVQIFAWGISYLLQPTSAVYYPIETLPLVLQKIAHATPLMYVFEGYRLTYQGTFSTWHFLWALGLSVIYFIVCYLIFLKSIRTARKKGLLAHY
jgi:ABC-2 type transport system permease protein